MNDDVKKVQKRWDGQGEANRLQVRMSMILAAAAFSGKWRGLGTSASIDHLQVASEEWGVRRGGESEEWRRGKWKC